MVGIRSFPIGFWPIFRGELLVSGRVQNSGLVLNCQYAGSFEAEIFLTSRNFPDFPLGGVFLCGCLLFEHVGRLPAEGD